MVHNKEAKNGFLHVSLTATKSLKPSNGGRCKVTTEEGIWFRLIPSSRSCDNWVVDENSSTVIHYVTEGIEIERPALKGLEPTTR